MSYWSAAGLSCSSKSISQNLGNIFTFQTTPYLTGFCQASERQTQSNVFLHGPGRRNPGLLEKDYFYLNQTLGQRAWTRDCMPFIVQNTTSARARPARLAPTQHHICHENALSSHSFSVTILILASLSLSLPLSFTPSLSLPRHSSRAEVSTLR